MNKPRQVTLAIHFTRDGKGAPRTIQLGEKPESKPTLKPGRIPRVSRMMALAIRFERLLSAGEINDYAEVARLGHLTRAQVSQIMNLRLLAPDIQEAVLFLPLTISGRDQILLRDLQPISLSPDWRHQRKQWGFLFSDSTKSQSPS